MPLDEVAFGGALSHLEALARRGGRPIHLDVREIVLHLGGLVLAERAAEAERQLRRVGEVRRCLGAGIDAALESEYALACAEYVQSVDVRFLGIPNYDFEYVIRARERLEARFEAAALLGVELPGRLLEQVARADELLASRVARLAPADRPPTFLRGFQEEALDPWSDMKSQYTSSDETRR